MEFESMVNHIPAGSKGVATVTHFTVSKDQSAMTAFRPREYVPSGTYVRLTVKGTLMMSDTSMERGSNWGVVRAARGHVFVAGLGVGLILLPILRKPEVKSVTVLEKYQDVIDLVLPHIPDPEGKLKVICGDAFEWKPEKGTKYDCIYFDIWPNITTDNLPEMATLHRRFAKCKAPNAWMDSWMRHSLKAQKRREDREDARWRLWKR